MASAATVVLADGDFPEKGSAAYAALTAAKRVVACDGAADAYRRRFGRWPTAVVGDLDSLAGRPPAGLVFRIAEQETNDLEKAVRWCRERGWRRLTVVGATGGREDHAIGNVFRALELDVEILTDRGRFVPVARAAAFRVRKGAAVSVFAPDPKTRMTSTGLAWPLAPVRFRTLACATLNRATGTRFTVTTTRPVLVYIAL